MEFVHVHELWTELNMLLALIGVFFCINLLRWEIVCEYFYRRNRLTEGDIHSLPHLDYRIYTLFQILENFGDCLLLGHAQIFLTEKELIARLFSEKTRGIAIALASSLSSSCKHFDIL